MVFKQRASSPGLFGSVSRRTYWLWIGGLMLALIVLCAWAGLYYVQVPEEHADQRVRSNGPLSTILYSPVGNAVVMVALQYFAANLVFWSGLWIGAKVRRSGKALSDG